MDAVSSKLHDTQFIRLKYSIAIALMANKARRLAQYPSKQDT